MQRMTLIFSRTDLFSFIAALVVGIGASFVLWHVVFPERQDKQLTDTVGDRRTVARVVPSTSNHAIELNKILKLESPTDRSIAIYTLVGGMSGHEIRNLLNKTLSFTPSKTVQSVRIRLLEELTWQDPTNALSFVEKIDSQLSVDLVSTVFAEWAQFDLEDALQATSKLEEVMKTRSLWAIFFSRPDLTVAARVALVEQHGGNPILVRRLVTESSTFQFSDQPLTALQTLVADELDDNEQVIAFYRLTDYWYDRDGISSIGEMLDRFYSLFQDQHSLLRNLVKKVSAFDPQTAWNHVLALSSETRRKLAPMVVEAWGIVDFDEAHKAIMEANMPFALGVLFQSLASSDPERALAEIDQVPLEYGLSVFMRLVNRLPRDVMLEHLEQHGSLGPDTNSATRLLVQLWSSQDPENAVGWLLANSSKLEWINSVHLLDGLISLGSVDLDRAFAIALEQPKSESATGMEYSLLLGLMRNGQLAGIEEFLKRVRKPKQFDIYTVTGSYLVQVGKFDEAFELGNQLSETEWSEYFRTLTSTGIWRDAERFIEKMSLLPNSEIRNEIARYILELRDMDFYPSRMSVSNTDLQYLQTLLEEE